MATPTLLLASSSPRRRELLAQIGVEPARVQSPDIDETPGDGELPRAYAARLAREKALAVARSDHEVVLAGDTTVALGRRILDQAANGEDVRRFLQMLSGRRHRVFSGVAVVGREGQVREKLSESVVRFKRLSHEEIEAYVDSGEGIGKAGGYAIQGHAGALVDFVSGSYSGVVGLPLYETRILLKSEGFPIG